MIKVTESAAALRGQTAGDIQEHFRRVIEEKHPERAYSVKRPPTGRPVRIYADGVYDLFHCKLGKITADGHMLQLRQCKLAFEDVTLIVGVCSDELVASHKARTTLRSQERYESVRNCRWVDTVVEDAPWVITPEFIDKWEIDYVAHDEAPYASSSSDDVYAYLKEHGMFLPTRRTEGVSTSELLERIVGQYIQGDYDTKLEKIGATGLVTENTGVKESKQK